MTAILYRASVTLKGVRTDVVMYARVDLDAKYLECIKLGKFNNTLSKDKNYTGEMREFILQIGEKYESLNDNGLVWE